jgi:phosphohistidine phosphatase
MKTLMLLRHAKSSRDDPELDDHERPLNPRGKADAKRMGRLIQDEKIVPDLIVSSTALRARKTAEKVVKQSGYTSAIELEDRLYLSDAAAHYAVVQETGRRHARLLLVGHNPGLSEFLSRLTSADEELPTGALAIVELPLDAWKELIASTRGKLVALYRPRELKR